MAVRYPGRTVFRAVNVSVLVVLSMVLFSGTTSASSLLDRIVAVVNKEVITWSELYMTMEFEATPEMKSLNDAEKKKLFKENESLFLEGMIDKKLILQAARGLDITASKEETTEAMEGIKKKYAMDEKEFAESLKKEGLTLEEYKKRLTEQIIMSKVVGQQVRSKIVVGPSEINEYIAKNKDSEYRLRLILFKRPEKDTDRDKYEARAGEVLQKLKEGESFSSLAQRYSDDPSGRTGGDLGAIKRQYLGKELLEVLDQMSVGDVSRPFWTDRGLQIIKLEEKFDAKNADELREIAQRRILEQRFSDEYKNWIRSLREKAYVEVRL